MNTQKPIKAKRQKKKKARTEVVSSGSDSEGSAAGDNLETSKSQKKSKGDGSLTDAEVSAAFTKIYLQRATVEFAEDLDKIRGADDFKDDALEILIASLKQGMGVFGQEEMRRIVTAGAVVEGGAK